MGSLGRRERRGRGDAGDRGAMVLPAGAAWGRETRRLQGAGVGLEDCDFAITIMTALLPSNALIFLTDSFMVKINERAVVFRCTVAVLLETDSVCRVETG